MSRLPAPSATTAARPAGAGFASKAVPDRIPVWDIAVRTFHWSLVLLVATAWWTGGSAGRWHEVVGYTVFGLIVFRIAWGFAGTRHALFAHFVKSPLSIISYLNQLRSGRAHRFLGHNPAGGAMILALIVCLLVVCNTGWMMQTRRLFGVPWVEDLHHLAADAMLVLVPLHIAGVVISSWLHRENLVLAMITGSKPVQAPAERRQAPDTLMRARFERHARHGLAILLLLAVIGASYGWIVTGRRVSTSIPAPAAEAPEAETPKQ